MYRIASMLRAAVFMQMSDLGAGGSPTLQYVPPVAPIVPQVADPAVDLSSYAKQADFEIIADRMDALKKDFDQFTDHVSKIYSPAPDAPAAVDDTTVANMTAGERDTYNQKIRDYQAAYSSWLKRNLTPDDIAYLRKNVFGQ